MPSPWKQAVDDFRMGTAFWLISWALQIMPYSDPEAQRIAAAVKYAITGGVK